jgi:hypothetical protein
MITTRDFGPPIILFSLKYILIRLPYNIIIYGLISQTYTYAFSKRKYVLNIITKILKKYQTSLRIFLETKLVITKLRDF